MQTAFAVLQQIFRHTRYGQAPGRRLLCRRLRLTDADLEGALHELEVRGLIDPAKLRLTLPGLAVAAALRRPVPASAKTLPCPASSAASPWRFRASPSSSSGSWAATT